MSNVNSGDSPLTTYRVEKLIAEVRKERPENSGLIERSIIDDRHLVDGLMTPEILHGRVSKEFFNTIDTFRSFEIPESGPSGRNNKHRLDPTNNVIHRYKI
jgi:hypothetical protein